MFGYIVTLTLAALAYTLGKRQQEPSGEALDGTPGDPTGLPPPVPPLVAGTGLAVAGITTDVLADQCEWDKPSQPVDYEGIVIGPGKGRVVLPVMNAYAGCRTPLQVLLCLRTSAPTNAVFPSGGFVPIPLRPQSKAVRFVLEIIGAADGSPKSIKIKHYNQWGTCPAEFVEPTPSTDFKRIKPVVVDGAAGLQIEYDTGTRVRVLRVRLDATGT